MWDNNYASNEMVTPRAWFHQGKSPCSEVWNSALLVETQTFVWWFIVAERVANGLKFRSSSLFCAIMFEYTVPCRCYSATQPIVYQPYKLKPKQPTQKKPTCHGEINQPGWHQLTKNQQHTRARGKGLARGEAPLRARQGGCPALISCKKVHIYWPTYFSVYNLLCFF
jgi:hypothetical protein